MDRFTVLKHSCLVHDGNIHHAYDIDKNVFDKIKKRMGRPCQAMQKFQLATMRSLNRHECLL
jgi:hypothetical protein